MFRYFQIDCLVQNVLIFSGNRMILNYTRLLTVTLLSVFLLAGCAATGGSSADKEKKAKAEVKWPFAKDGILIELVSDVSLNFYANQAHTLVLGVVQLEDEKAFPKLLTEPQALADALATGDLPKGALHLDRYVVSPDTRIVMKLDRVQDAKFVGLVAGYYQFEPQRSARYFRIPLNLASSGLVFKDYTATPATLALQLSLGPQRIVNAVSMTHDPDATVVKQEVLVDNSNLEIEVSPEVLKKTADEASSLMKL